MHKDILSIDNFIANHSNFKKSKDEKRQTIADAFYMSFVRSRTDISYLSLFKEGKVIDLKLFETSKGNIYNYIPPILIPLAKELFKRKGNGTPNASSGKGELLLHLFSEDIKNPTKGDVSVFNKKYEIKANGGKIGLGKGDKINKLVVDKCLDVGIELPKAKSGRAAKGKPQFFPHDDSHKKHLGKNFLKVLEFWWEALTGNDRLPVSVYSFNDLRPHIIKEFIEPILKDNDALICITSAGDYEIFRSTENFLSSKYNTESVKWEMRAYQKNPISIYLGKE